MPRVVFFGNKGCVLLLWVRFGCGLGWVQLGQKFHYGMGWVRFSWSFGWLGWVEKIGPTDNSDLFVYLVSSKALSCNYDLIKKSFYRAFNAIYGKVGRLASVDVVIELFKTKCMPILLYGLDACPVSTRQIRSLNHVVVSCGRKIFEVNSSDIARECLKMFGVSDVAEAVATRKDRFVKRYALSSSVVCEICTIYS